MKLTNVYAANGSANLAIIEDGKALNLAELDKAETAFTSLARWLRSGEKIQARTLALLNDAKGRKDAWIALESIRYAPLIDRDCRIFCVGLNYADHAAEVKLPIPTSPVFFSKLASTVIPQDGAIVLPRNSQQTDYEAEFAFMIGRRARNVPQQFAADHIAGYTIMHDVSARDLQFHDGQWFRGKNCDTFAPMGPWLVTTDDIPHANHLNIQLRLNGTIRQNSNTSNLVFGPAALVSFLSQSLTLEPGDVISTGTPGGIGFYADPKVFLQPGDIAEIEVESIGTLRNAVASAD